MSASIITTNELLVTFALALAGGLVAAPLRRQWVARLVARAAGRARAARPGWAGPCALLFALAAAGMAVALYGSAGFIPLAMGRETAAIAARLAVGVVVLGGCLGWGEQSGMQTSSGCSKPSPCEGPAESETDLPSPGGRGSEGWANTFAIPALAFAIGGLGWAVGWVVWRAALAGLAGTVMGPAAEKLAAQTDAPGRRLAELLGATTGRWSAAAVILLCVVVLAW